MNTSAILVIAYLYSYSELITHVRYLQNSKYNQKYTKYIRI